MNESQRNFVAVLVMTASCVVSAFLIGKDYNEKQDGVSTGKSQAVQRVSTTEIGSTKLTLASATKPVEEVKQFAVGEICKCQEAGEKCFCMYSEKPQVPFIPLSSEKEHADAITTESTAVSVEPPTGLIKKPDDTPVIAKPDVSQPKPDVGQPKSIAESATSTNAGPIRAAGRWVLRTVGFGRRSNSYYEWVPEVQHYQVQQYQYRTFGSGCSNGSCGRR